MTSFDQLFSLTFSASMRIYKDKSFTEPFLSQPTFNCKSKVDCTERVYIGIHLTEDVAGKSFLNKYFQLATVFYWNCSRKSDLFRFWKLEKDLKLMLVHLWATPTIPDRRLGVNDDYYAWVISGCPNQDVQIHENGKSSRIEVSTPTFKFTNSEDVYFHAQVKACYDSDCVRLLLNEDFSEIFRSFATLKAWISKIFSKLEQTFCLVWDDHHSQIRKLWQSGR